jgi:hypothetical protein
MTIDHILAVLNEQKARATYGAVGKVLDIHPRNVGKLLGQRRPEASWVVSAETGKPNGYSPSECHEDLYSNPTVLRTGEQLLAIMK